MKKLLLALAIMALFCSPALAGVNANGSLVLHTDNTLNWTSDPIYCTYTLPTTCEALNTDAELYGQQVNVVWVIGAWLPTAAPRVKGVQFGINYSGPIGAGLENMQPCGPGVLEIPTATWPFNGSPAGTALAYNTAVMPTNNLLPIYYFSLDWQPGLSLSTQAYPGGDGQAEFADDSTPPVIDFVTKFGTVNWGAPGANQCPTVPVETGACCFPDGMCTITGPNDCGGIYQGADTVCEPTNPCPQPEACCFPLDGSCQFLLVTECVALGGNPQGPGTTCATVECPQPPRPEACCFPDGSCQFIMATDCTAQGGVPQGIDTTCETVACPAPEACCLPDGTCQMLLVDACAGLGGTPQGPGTICENVQCPPPVPTKPSSWGQIKANYR